MPKIIQLDFNKDENNKTILTDQENLDKLFKWVFPIIEENEGWGSGDLTKESFLKNPSKYQDTIDATIWKNVHILLDNEEPVALLEYGKTTIAADKERHAILNSLFDGENLEEFNSAVGKNVDLKDLSKAKEFLINKPIYTAVGVVLKPILQHKNSGYSEELYKLISDGIVFGWTSNPVVVRKRRTQFKNTLFFPAFGEFPNNIEEWAICLYVYAYIISHVKVDYAGLTFGTMFSPYFVEQRGSKYLDIASEMRKQGKISETDEKRIAYSLGKNSCAGAIVSWN